MPRFPAFEAALEDESIAGTPQIVYLRLSRRLDFYHYRPVKSYSLEAETHLSDRTVRWAIALLIQKGYLEMGPGDGRTRSYRLVYALPDEKAKDATEPVPRAQSA